MSSVVRQVHDSNGLFFKQHAVKINEMISVYFYLDISKIVADYVTSHDNPFGADEWRRYFDVDPGSEPKLYTESFIKFWNGSDPIDKTQKVCDTHFPPVLRPQSIVYISKCFLGNRLGIEKSLTYSRCKERVNYDEEFSQMVIGNFDKDGGLGVESFDNDLEENFIGISVIGKFQSES